MPFRDGTGPEGRGPLTGGARGDCAVVLPDDAQGRTAPVGYVGRRGLPLGLGRGLLGLGRRIWGGRGRGLGRRWR